MSIISRKQKRVNAVSKALRLISVALIVVLAMAETYGVAITPIWMLTVFIISVILAIAAPPVPGAALTCYTILFMQLGIPTEAIAVVIALNVILEFVDRKSVV